MSDLGQTDLNTALLQELVRNRPRVVEKQFEIQLCQELILAGHLPCKLSFRTETDDLLNGCTYPDICLIGEDAMSPVAAIECKADSCLHSLTTALGQCLVYKQFAPLVIICVPDASSIPALIRTVADQQDILITDGHNFGLFMSKHIEQRGLKPLRILLSDSVYVPPKKCIVIPMPRTANAA